MSTPNERIIRRDEAYEAGAHAGWDAANYAQAYGGPDLPTMDALPGWIANAPEGERLGLKTVWVLGARDGSALFNRGLALNGAPLSA